MSRRSFYTLEGFPHDDLQGDSKVLLQLHCGAHDILRRCGHTPFPPHVCHFRHCLPPGSQAPPGEVLTRVPGALGFT